MKLTEVSTNSQDIFPFAALLGDWAEGMEGIGGGLPLQTCCSCSLLVCGRGRLIGLLLLGDPLLPSHGPIRTFSVHACVFYVGASVHALVQTSADARNLERVYECVCPSALL